MGTTNPTVRERLLETACDLFYREGISAVGVQRVIEEADAAKASLYAHFPPKDDRVAASLARMSDRTRARFDADLAAAPNDPRARIIALFESLERWSRSPEFRGCPFGNAASELAGRPAVCTAAIAEHRAWLHGELDRLARATGDPDPALLARTLLLLMDGAMSAATIDHAEDAMQVARRAVERLLSPR